MRFVQYVQLVHGVDDQAMLVIHGVHAEVVLGVPLEEVAHGGPACVLLVLTASESRSPAEHAGMRTSVRGLTNGETTKTRHRLQAFRPTLAFHGSSGTLRAP